MEPLSLIISIVELHSNERGERVVRYVCPKPPPNLKPPQCITCICLMLPHVCMWYILVVLGSVTVLSIDTLVTYELVDY